MKRKLLFLLTIIATGIHAAFGQCSVENNTFSSQADIDNFAVNYPACKWLTNPVINGADITNLNGLKKIERVFGSLRIYGNTSLTNLDGLSSLYLIGGALDIYNNPALVNLDGLSAVIVISGAMKVDNNPVLTNITGLQKIGGIAGLTITNNPGLRVCNLPNFCTYLSNGANPRTISGNLANCLNETAVTTACSVGCPAGDISLYSQADVDAFGETYAHCTNITLGNVTVNGPDIANIDAFSQVKKITGNLHMVNNPSLVSLEGLRKLQIIEGNLLVYDNPSLADIDGLEDITNIGSVLIWNNAALTNIDGLIGLLGIGENVMILNNSSLTDISGLQSLNTNTITGVAGLAIVDNEKLAVCDLPNICRYLSDTGRPRTISGNLANCLDEAALAATCAVACPWGNFGFYSQDDLDEFGTKYAHCTNITLGDVMIYGNSITDLSALNNVVKIEGDLDVLNNPLLTSLDGLNNVNDIGKYVRIDNNPSLASLNGLSGLTGIGGDVDIENNPSLTSFNGLNNLTTIAGYFNTRNNSSLANLDGLAELAGIGNNLYIESNPFLINFDGLSSLTAIGGELSISGNSRLADIRGLRNLGLIGGYFLEITDNPNLSLCNLPYFCSYLTGYRNRLISGNLGKCATQWDVSEACSLHCSSFDFSFYSQEQLDEFGVKYAHCTDIALDALTISGEDIVSLENLQNVTSIGWITQIYDNDILTSLAGLENIANIGGNFYIEGNAALTNLAGLESLKGIERNLYIDGNAALASLSGLGSLTSVGGEISIANNTLLSDISALSDVDPATISGNGLSIINNPALSLCAFPNLCTYLSIEANPRTISGNLGDCATEAALQPVCAVALPVTLAGFTAVRRGGVNLLEWHTAMEVPGDLFEIEHSADGRAFRKIGAVDAKGIEGSRYSFVDENPAPGVSYYRLHMVNTDGSRAYGKIAAVVAGKAGGTVLSAYPNPFTGNVEVKLEKTNGEAVITVSDVSGKVLQSEMVKGNTHSLSLEHLSSGVYFIRYRDEVVSETLKVVK